MYHVLYASLDRLSRRRLDSYDFYAICAIIIFIISFPVVFSTFIRRQLLVFDFTPLSNSGDISWVVWHSSDIFAPFIILLINLFNCLCTLIPLCLKSSIYNGKGILKCFVINTTLNQSRAEAKRDKFLISRVQSHWWQRVQISKQSSTADYSYMAKISGTPLGKSL